MVLRKGTKERKFQPPWQRGKGRGGLPAWVGAAEAEEPQEEAGYTETPKPWAQDLFRAAEGAKAVDGQTASRKPASLITPQKRSCLRCQQSVRSWARFGKQLPHQASCAWVGRSLGGGRERRSRSRDTLAKARSSCDERAVAQKPRLQPKQCL